MKYVLMFVAVLIFSRTLSQCQDSGKLLLEGDLYYDRREYLVAMHKYLAAIADCPDHTNVIERKLQKVVLLIPEYKDSCLAIASRIQTLSNRLDSLETAVVSASNHMVICLRRKAELDSSLASKREFISDLEGGIGRTRDSLRHLGQKYALSHGLVAGEWRYYYVDRQGRRADEFGYWVHATPFDEDGFAEVRSEYETYLIGVNGFKMRFTLGQHKFSDQVLDIRFQRKRYLPESVYYSPELTTLVADRNRIRKIPDRIDMCYRLNFVSMSFNRLKSFRSLTQVRCLQTLVLRNNLLAEIPAKVRRLESLRYLDLSFNNIAEVPAELFNLRNLEHVHLEHNLLKELPSDIKGLERVQHLDLSFNSLVNIPKEIRELKNLRFLGLTGNRISSLSLLYKLIAVLPNLKVLRIGANPCSDTPEKRQEIREKIASINSNCIVKFN